MLPGSRHELISTLQLMGVKPWHAPALSEQMLQRFNESQDTSMDSNTLWLLVVEQCLREWNYFHLVRGLSEYTTASAICQRRRSLCILLGGTSGCGKSTLAALLASRLGITTVVSTDHIRQWMRQFMSPEDYPALYASSYHVNEVLPPTDVHSSSCSSEKSSSSPESNTSSSSSTSTTTNNRSAVIAGFHAQSELLLPHLQALVRRCARRKESLIMEGVHLSVKVIQQLMTSVDPSIDVVFLPFLLFISNRLKHTERFAIRAKYMTLEPRFNKYILYFQNIRAIQHHLCSLADACGIPKVDNTNMDRSLAIIHQTTLEYICSLPLSHSKPTVTLSSMLIEGEGHLVDQVYMKAFHRVSETYWGSKAMLQYLREKQSQLTPLRPERDCQVSTRQRSSTAPLPFSSGSVSTPQRARPAFSETNVDGLHALRRSSMSDVLTCQSAFDDQENRPDLVLDMLSRLSETLPLGSLGS